MSTVKPSPVGFQSDMNLLRPSLKAGQEERRRAASITRLLFLGVALIVWTLVGLKVWDIRIVVSERRSDELEKVRINQQISELQAILSQVPSGVLNAREDLFTQVKWSARLNTLKALALPGQAFAAYGAEMDGTVHLVGAVRDPAVYADILDRISHVPFVTAVQASFLKYEDKVGYAFQVTFSTLPTEEK